MRGYTEYGKPSKRFHVMVLMAAYVIGGSLAYGHAWHRGCDMKYIGNDKIRNTAESFWCSFGVGLIWPAYFPAAGAVYALDPKNRVPTIRIVSPSELNFSIGGTGGAGGTGGGGGGGGGGAGR